MICPKCDTENPESARYCSHCGTKFEPSHENTLPAEEEQHVESVLFEEVRPYLKILLILLILLIFAYLVLHFWKSAPTAHSYSTTAIVTTTIISNPSNGMAFLGDIKYTSNITLTGNIGATGNVVIEKGVIVTTNGHSIIAGGTLNNQGQIDAGNPGDSAPESTSGKSYPNSYGGSGGAGGGGGGQSESGSVAGNASLSNTEISLWFNGGFINYLTGAGGGGACALNESGGAGGSTTVHGGIVSNVNSFIPCVDSGGSPGASGSYGIYLQGRAIVAGSVSASGLQSAQGQGRDSGGGGGGGVVIFSYGPGGFTSGSYNVAGGAAQQDSGAGGAGQVWIYPYGNSLPINP